MKIEITILIEDIDEESVNFTLMGHEYTDVINWARTDEYPTGPEFELTVVTDKEMKHIIKLKAGKNIITPPKDIKDLFLNALFELNLERQTEEADGFEHIHDEDEIENNTEENPYDPKLIRVDTKPFVISYVETLMSSGDLDISPDFQREFVWTDIPRKSRLIESLLLRIPIPVFYLSQDSEGVFKVVDGVHQ